MKKLKSLILAVVMTFQCFSVFAEPAEGWTNTVVGDFGTADLSAEVSATKAYSGSNAMSIVNMNMVKDESKYLEVKNTLNTTILAGTYTLKYYVSKNGISKEPDVFLGNQKLTVTSADSSVSGWKEYTAQIDYTGDETDSLSFRFYYMVNSYFIDEISLTMSGSTDNLITNSGFEGDKVTPELPDEPDEPDDPDEPPEPDDTDGYPDVETEMTKYQPSTVLFSTRDASLIVNWRNPATNTLKKVSLYDITGGKEELVSDELPTVPSRSVYHKIDGLTGGKNYQYKIVFSYDDMHDYTYFIGEKLEGKDIVKGAWTAQRIRKKGVAYSPTMFELDTGEAKDGKVSAKIISNVDKNVNDFSECYIRLNQTVEGMDLTVGNSYKVSFWVKAQNSSNDMQAHMSWSMFSHGHARIADTSGTYDWQYKEYTYKCESNPKNMLVFICDGYTDAIWIDDVQMYKLENGQPTGENLIKNGSFEDILTADLSEIDEINAEPGTGSVKLDWITDENYNGANIYCEVDGHYEWRGKVSKDITEITVENLYQDREYTYLIAPLNSENTEGKAVKVTFKTLYEDFTVRQPVLKKSGVTVNSVADGGDYILTVAAKNNSVADGMKYTVLAAVFDENDIMTEIYSDSKVIEMTDVNAPDTVIDIPMNIPAGSYMQVYVMDSVETAERFYETVYY